MVKNSRRLVLAIALGVPWDAGTAQTAADSSLALPLSPPMTVVREELQRGTVTGIRWPRVQDVAADLLRAYGSVGWTPLWTHQGRPTRAAFGAIRYLRDVESEGLSPSDFDVAALDSMVRLTASDTLSTGDQARFEVTLSVATARALSTLRWGRVQQPKAYPTVRRSQREYDLALGVYAVARTSEPRPVFTAAAPPYEAYRRLALLMAMTRSLASTPLLASEEFQEPTEGLGYAGTPELRQVLRALGVLPDSVARPGILPDTVYTTELAAAVSLFQKENRRKPTGVLDKGTRLLMRRILQGRVRDAELTLERWRWLPRRADGRAIIVNVPEFRLHTYEQVRAEASPSISMKVVVGRGEEKRFTPMFTDELEHIIFSPYWEVPQSIAVEEIVPKVATDSTYLRRNRYIVVKGYSDSAPRVAPDSATLAGIGTAFRVRQLPGDYNSLGRVKFMLPNHLNVYLHDTNEKHLFQQPQRAFSHGCVRVAEPTRLAEWALRNDAGWTTDRMQAAMKADQPEKVELAEAIPVMIVYHTGAVDEGGVLRSYRDVYKLDAELSDLLAKGYPYR